MHLWVNPKLKEKFPNDRYWPGVKERFRLYQKRSQWFQGSIDHIERLFKELEKSDEFGLMLFVRNSRHVNVPKLWTEFKEKVQSNKKEKRDRVVAEKEKDVDFQRV